MALWTHSTERLNMPALASELRTRLERTIIQARTAAESGARAALDALAVKRNEPLPHDDPRGAAPAQRPARPARQLGSGVQADGFEPLVEEVAYEQWHRMLFARFLAENDLLMHPPGRRRSRLAECAELAPEEGRGRCLGAWPPATPPRCCPASSWPTTRPVQVRFAPEGRQTLEAILAGLPPAVFTADDAPGLGLPVLADRQEEGGQRQRAQDRRGRPARR